MTDDGQPGPETILSYPIHHHSVIMSTEMSVTTGLYDRFLFPKKDYYFFIFTLVRVRPSRLAHQRQSTSYIAAAARLYTKYQ